MALTISIEGKGVIANADSYTDTATSGSTWNEDGAGTDAFTTFTYQMGGVCFAGAYSNKAGFQYFDYGSGNTPLDFDVGGAEEGQHFIIPIMSQVLGVIENKSIPGMTIRLGTDLTNYREWVIAGGDDANGWDGRWRPFMLDPTSAGTSDTGTYDPGSVRYFGVYIDCSALVSGNVIFIDQLIVGKGLRITGDSTTFWKDVADWCTDYFHATTPRAWNFVQDIADTYLMMGKFFIGDATSQVANMAVSDTARNIKFIQPKYWNGTAWVVTMDVDSMGVVVEEHASYTTSYTDTGLVLSGNVDINVDIDTSAATSASMTGGALNDLDLFKTGSADTTNGKILTDITASNISNTPIGSTWNTSGLITLQLGGGLDDCIINKSTGAVAVIGASSSLVADTSFISDGTGHAFEATTTGTYNWENTDSGYGASDTTDAVFYNNSGGAITLNVINNGTTPTVRNGTDASTTVVSGTVTIKAIIYELATGNPISGVRVHVTKDVGGAVVLDGVTDSNGVVQDTGYTYTADEAISGRARFNQGNVYKTGNLSGTITSSGVIMTQSLIAD